MPRTRITTLAALLLAALFLAGCGGSGGGEPTVTQTLHDELQAELDAALADLEKERKAKADEEAARETVEGAVTRLRGELETATDNATRLTDELATATTGVGRLTAQLATANNNVESLTDRIGTADDADSLQGMLAAEKARVTTLTNQIGTATDTANAAESASLYAQLKAAKAKVTKLTGEIGDTITPNSLKARLATAQARVTALEGELSNADDQVSRLTQDLATARGERDTERQRADDANERARTAQEQAQGQEANQRAKNLKEVLDADIPINDSSPVVFDLTTSGSLKLTHGRKSDTLRGSGLRSVTMSTGAGGTGKTVVYTDVELSRGVVEHYLPGQNATRLAVNTAFGDLTTDNVIPEVSGDWEISHDFKTSIEGTNETPAVAPNEKSATSYSGSLHDVPGRFECTGTNCQVQVDPVYSFPSDGDISLQSVRLSSVNAQGEAITGGAVYFVSSRSISLYVGGPVGEDKKYMVFGYWREDPASPSGVYKFDVFADVIGTPGTVPADITANYDGTAVGAYAEKDPGTAVETWRQGEFTADVDLTASSTSVYGTIDDFVTTPTGGSTAPKTAGRWRVDLASASIPTSLNDTNGTLHLPQMAGSQMGGDGTWAHAFVPSRQDTNGVPPTVAGTFKASIENSLTLVGAFGAEKQ